ncbi:related to alkaline phosphatase [Melanopsichium pennsylvanicum]|uniref:Related to alkaline phosphatase n=2 Tax=Melanopsichium pennsylvanicum TaxID=63383 RepID=A0AAJ4XJ68_9BASI|nr:alkaline phosphatase [Melanopsichium pennsylvanicum 4]SNX83007.1 related to alkaline phosphatase [Melanopsichium pennsylvanicum]
MKNIFASFAALAAALTVSVSALVPLERNLAYRSPSLSLSNGDGLSHDIEHIGSQIRKRAYDHYVTSKVEGKAKRNNGKKNASYKTEADFLVEKYDKDYGSDGRDAYKGKVSFPYGVAAGDPYPDSAILWTHPVPEDSQTKLPVCLRYQTSKNKNDFSKENLVDDSYAWTTSEVDYSFKVETSGLSPKTQYYYRFFTCHDPSNVSPVGSFKSIPDYNDEDVDSLRLAVFSCSNLPFGYFNAYRAAAARKNGADYFVHVGDYIYEARGDGQTVEGESTYGDGRAINRVPAPDHEIVTLDDYRLRYGSYRKDKDLQTLHGGMAFFGIWDDHEVADNSYNHGTADSNNTDTGAVRGVRFTERKLAAVKAYYEWMPIRQVDTTDSLRIWRSFRYGKLADLFMLDTRNFDRDITDIYWNTPQIAALSNDTDRSLMGGKQEQWLYRNMIKSEERGATWKILSQQIVTNWQNYGTPSFMYNYDAWQGYRSNRRRLFDTIVNNKIDNTVILAGDSHANWVYDTVPEDRLNNTAYDPVTGKGSIGVEFAGTAVSSPSSYGANLTEASYLETAKKLVSINKNLQWAEGAHRGYFELEFTKTDCNAQFYGYVNNTNPNSDELLVAQFNVKKGANKLTRPINYGISPNSGSLQSQAVDYDKQKWNGTAFVVQN